MAADAIASCVVKTSACMVLNMTSSYLSWENISTVRVISMWRSGIDCKNMSMFLMKNLTRKGSSKYQTEYLLLIEGIWDYGMIK